VVTQHIAIMIIDDVLDVDASATDAHRSILRTN
jgi:hypothetical protein